MAINLKSLFIYSWGLFETMQFTRGVKSKRHPDRVQPEHDKRDMDLRTLMSPSK